MSVPGLYLREMCLRMVELEFNLTKREEVRESPAQDWEAFALALEQKIDNAAQQERSMRKLLEEQCSEQKLEIIDLKGQIKAYQFSIQVGGSKKG